MEILALLRSSAAKLSAEGAVDISRYYGQPHSFWIITEHNSNSTPSSPNEQAGARTLVKFWGRQCSRHKAAIFSSLEATTIRLLSGMSLIGPPFLPKHYHLAMVRAELQSLPLALLIALR